MVLGSTFTNKLKKKAMMNKICNIKVSLNMRKKGNFPKLIH